jgi:membrane protein DedA with SNARE-associated domain
MIATDCIFSRIGNHKLAMAILALGAIQPPESMHLWNVHLAGPWATIGWLATATLVSEDITCIAAGQLIAMGQVHWIVGLLGCGLGIYLGDLALFLAGRLAGRGLLAMPWVARRVPAAKIEPLARWFDERPAVSIFAARFLPGTRLPLYVAAGLVGRRGWSFAGWTLVAALVWTPLLVLLAGLGGDRFTRPLQSVLGGGWVSLAGVTLVCFAILRWIAMPALQTAASSEVFHAHSSRLLAAVSRIWQWEFWPSWLFYLPISLWIILLSIRRGGLSGFASVTAANPGIPDGGFIGESKFQILQSLASPHVIPTILIEPGPPARRLNQFEEAMRSSHWSYPVILKPDAGQRGEGLKLARSTDDAAAYLADHPSAVLLQPYHPGPYEAGIFYYRIPGEPVGGILSITDKRFPEIIGNGRLTVEQLIRRDHRYRMQANTFLARHASQADRVLADGERMRLAIAGNHCQGTLFLDGSHLCTLALEKKIDAIAKSFDGFYFGRFDVRYSEVAEFMAGRDLAIIELNGVTSESTNIYDPSRSLLSAYRTLARQWSILFRIADANRRRGIRPTRPMTLLRQIICFYRHREIALAAD